MNKLLLLGAALLAAGVLLCPTEAQTRRKELNVREPVDSMVSAWKAFQAKLTLDNIMALVLAVLPCLNSIIQTSDPALTLTEKLIHALQDENFQEDLASKLQQVPIAEMIEKLNLEGYCSTPDFKILHDYVWKKPSEFADLLNFLHRFGYPEIYDSVKEAYVKQSCPQELIDSLPTGPQDTFSFSNQKLKSVNEPLPDIRGQVINELNSAHHVKAECNVTKVIEALVKVGTLDLLNFVNTVTSELSYNPSLHFLLGKIQEPAKGASVRGFQNLKPIKDILKKIDDFMKEDPLWRVVFALIKNATGLDFTRISFVNTILVVVEFIIWPQL